MPPVTDETTTRSTGAYAQPVTTAPRIDDVENDFNRSTGAYPMEKEPRTVFVDPDEDLSRSTMAYPMHDDPERLVDELAALELTKAEQAAVRTAGVTTIGLTSTAEVSYPTPGPASSGLTEDRVVKQRADLGLSPDPSGDSDAGYEARPWTHPVPGADGVDRDARRALRGLSGEELAAAEAEPTEAMAAQASEGTGGDAAAGTETKEDSTVAEPTAQTKTPRDAESKVVKPPVAPRPARRTQAEGK